MGTRRPWYALVLLVLWLSYYDHCAAPHAHCGDASGMCQALLTPLEGGNQPAPCPGSCIQSVEHDPVITMGTPGQLLPLPATYALPEWMQLPASRLASLEPEILPVPPAENASPPLLEMLTLALPVRGPSR